MPEQKGEVVIYRAENGRTAIDVRLEDETVWLTQKQMSLLFQKNIMTINEHIRNVFREGELDEGSTVRKSLIVQTEGNKRVSRQVFAYNLDVIISVGYRVKSKRGTQFRIWATNVLRDHLVKGYTLNRKALLRTNAKVAELQKTIALITSIRDKKLSSDEAQGLLTIIKHYADTWTTLQAYDSGQLKKRTSSKRSRPLSYDEVRGGLEHLKHELMRKGEAGELFAVEHGHGLEQILGAVFQTFGRTELYPSVEEKAAHLLYFIIKDHPFADGNKRSGAFVFMEFLRKNKSLVRKNGEAKINDRTLTALALLIAESKPNEKDRMIALITHLLKE
jgi:prophage maintenance system killer protein